MNESYPHTAEAKSSEAWMDNGPDYNATNFDYTIQASRHNTDYAGQYDNPEDAAAFEGLFDADNTPT
jgi:hypothetical protein